MYEGYQPPEEEGPEAKLAREQLAAEEAARKQHERDCWTADCLLASLKPRDARRRLVSFQAQRFWNLPRRARPVDNC